MSSPLVLDSPLGREVVNRPGWGPLSVGRASPFFFLSPKTFVAASVYEVNPYVSFLFPFTKMNNAFISLVLAVFPDLNTMPQSILSAAWFMPPFSRVCTLLVWAFIRWELMKTLVLSSENVNYQRSSTKPPRAGRLGRMCFRRCFSSLVGDERRKSIFGLISFGWDRILLRSETLLESIRSAFVCDLVFPTFGSPNAAKIPDLSRLINFGQDRVFPSLNPLSEEIRSFPTYQRRAGSSLPVSKSQMLSEDIRSRPTS